MLALCAAAGAQTFVGGRTDFRDETIYFAMTTRFYDGDPTNNVCGWDHQSVQIANNDPDWRGDFKGLIDKLDYIKALGFTAIWITPITQNASGTDFHGYHSMDFSTVDLRYESRTEWGASADVTFQSLIDAAHAKGMKIILDIVLNHTANFGEAGLNPLFTRDQDIRNQASAATAVIPNADKLGSDYNDLDGTTQYQRRFKYFKNPDYDTHNYYHHYGTGWNWDEPSRWWGQIAGDCVDLNTENKAVSDYLVKCYGQFIKMGVDGFRIDTSGHISRLTFNHSFIPQFLALGEQYASKRLNNCPFYMFGEVCARYSQVIYRDQHNLSSHFYTWASDQSLLSQWNDDATWWDSQYLREGHDSPVGNMALCTQETSFSHSSSNVFMQNGAWHTPDYSEASGFNVIDFPMHYNFNNAASAIGIAKQGDAYYNDASFNVVYVDSHDYCPGPDDGTRFNGGTAQWAENLSLMFTFRGIPCIYYGSEVEFKKGCKVDAGGTDMPVMESGRAYFGNYIEGTVTASDFGQYTASGNVAQTLNADLAQHVRRLNLIRAAVPALRKGQYTFDGCTANGGYAFKRAYQDSYALVAINGGATFTGVPSGTYVDLVTGQSYQGGGTITVSAPTNQGQLRVLVKGWTGGKVGEDGKFIYASSSVAHGGSVSFSDPGTTQYYTADDAIGQAHVSLSPAGGNFRTSTLKVTATLSETAVSGWYKIGANGTETQISSATTFTIGSDMAYGDTKTIYYSATDERGNQYDGSATFKKVDPNATITIYCKASSAPSLYVWKGTDTKLNGAWPGTTMTNTTTVDGQTFYYATFDEETINIIFSNSGSNQTADIMGITADAYYTFDGAGTATKYSPTGTSDPEPSDPTTSDVVVYYDNANSWSAVGCYAYVEDGSSVSQNAAWPGKTMTYDASVTINGVTGWWTYTVPSELAYGRVIVNNNNNGAQYPGGGEPGIKLSGKSIVITGTTVAELPAQQTPTAISRADANRGPVRIYSLDGRLVRGSLTSLPRGIYVAGGQMRIVR